MSKYTVQLKYPVEQTLKNKGLSSAEENWPEAYEMLGLSDYPIFDELHRRVLNDKIIRAYWFREIGFETVAHFSWQMRRFMHEIMPYYNQLYESENLIEKPMSDIEVGYKEKWSRDEDTTRINSSSSKSETDSRNVFQDTPMNGLDTEAIESMDYATNVTFDKADGNATSESKSGYNGDFIGDKEHTESGRRQSEGDLLLTYRKTFLNIDLEIVERVGVLFMALW